MNYDKDGNILTLQRYGASNNLVDSFAYDYITGTNKLKKVSGSLDQFTYDANGNVLKDDLTGPYDFKYDHRNLLLEFKSVEVENGDDWTRLFYDEAGNRVRKLTMRTSAKDPADPDWDNPGGDQTWTIISDEYYVRDVSGDEIMIYDGANLRQWNVLGNGNEGCIKSSGHKNYYLKDHLGSIRAVLDESRNVISAQDYDPWGHIYENRSYDSDTSVYKFTGKERDKNTGYDYFGARYYMSKIARWTSIDPLLEKHYDYSPYNYVLNNPLGMIDPDGRQEEPNDDRPEWEVAIQIVIPIAGSSPTGVVVVGAVVALGSAVYLGHLTYTHIVPHPGSSVVPHPVTDFGKDFISEAGPLTIQIGWFQGLPHFQLIPDIPIIGLPGPEQNTFTTSLFIHE